jgi:hypothetical protein
MRVSQKRRLDHYRKASPSAKHCAAAIWNSGGREQDFNFEKSKAARGHRAQWAGILPSQNNIDNRGLIRLRAASCEAVAFRALTISEFRIL